MYLFFRKIIFCMVVFISTVNADIVNFTPPGGLNIDSQNVSSGVFTIESFSGFNSALVETVILDSGDSGDNVSHLVNLGSGGGVAELIQYPGSFPIVQFDYNFNATVPDLVAISANVLSATTNFSKFLPLLSTNSGFYEVIDRSGDVTFHTTAAILDLSPSGFTNIDLLGNGTIFATFGAGDTFLSPGLFQDHGSVDISLQPPVPGIPVLAAVWLFGSGLLGLVGIRKKPK